MSQPRAKVLDVSVVLDGEGRLSADGSPPLLLPGELTPEHLLLAALVRCSLASLAYHGRRGGMEAKLQGAEAWGRITRRQEDGRYAFVDLACRLEVRVEPPPAPADLAALLAKAERDCFVGASLAVAPRYSWVVNGRPAAEGAP